MLRFTPILAMLLALSGCVEPVPQEPPAAPEVPKQVEPEPGTVKLEWVKQQVGVRFCGMVYEECHRLWVAELNEWGERAFPAYEAILANPRSDIAHVTGTCWALCKVERDRRCFIPVVLKRITEPNAMYQPVDPYTWYYRDHYRTNKESDVELLVQHGVGDAVRMLDSMARARVSVRESAIELLGEIGDERVSYHLIPLLTKKGELAYPAMKALAKIGGKRDLEAIDAWLKVEREHIYAQLLVHIDKCRDQLETRVKENPVPKYLIN